MRFPTAQIRALTRAHDLTGLLDTRSAAHSPEVAGRMVRELTWDSRDELEGKLFVCIRGERVDGHAFAADAVARGAACLLVTDSLDAETVDAAREAGVPVLLVDDVLAALRELAGAWRERLSATVVGLTGSSGKTTTKNLLRDVLSARFRVHATPANRNNELGVPATVLAAPEDAEVLVVEMGMRGSGQIAELCSFVRPDLGVITNVGESHIELLGSREAIARAKGELATSVTTRGGEVFLPASDGFTGLIAAECAFAPGRASLYGDAAAAASGREDGLATFARNVSLDADAHPCFEFHLADAAHAADAATAGTAGSDPAATAHVTVGLCGLHNVGNALAAAAVASRLGMDAAEVAEALAHVSPEKGRQDMAVTASGVLLIDDTYNANPSSVKAALSTLSSLQAKRRVAVLGDMGELGEHAPALHREVGRAAVAFGIDELVLVGELSAETARGAAEAAAEASTELPISHFHDKGEATSYLVDVLERGDAVLVKASRSMGLETVSEGLR